MRKKLCSQGFKGCFLSHDVATLHRLTTFDGVRCRADGGGQAARSRAQRARGAGAEGAKNSVAV